MFGSWSEDAPAAESTAENAPAPETSAEDAPAGDPPATTVRFTDVGMTRMICVDVDTWLERLDTARVIGDELHVLAGDGTRIGTLTRAR